MEVKKLDNKFAAYTFIAIILCWLVGILVIGGMADSAGADLNNFWEESVFSVLLYGLFLAVFFILCRQLKLQGREITRAVDLNTKVSAWNLFIVFLLAGLTIVSFMLLTQGVADIFIHFGLKPKSGIGHDGAAQYIMAVFVLCLLPAVIEELIFRGLILKGLLSCGKAAAVVASALLFSIFHFNPEQTVYQFILGVVLALVVLKTGNLLYSMILHFLNNFAIVTTYIFCGDPVNGLVWNAQTVVLAVALAGFGALLILGVIRALRAHGGRTEISKTAKFWAFANIGFFVAAALGSCIWVIMLLG